MSGLTRSFAFIGLLGLFVLPAGAAPPNSGLSSLWAYGRDRGPQELSRVVGVVGFFGQNQPQQWLLLSADVKVPGLMHEFVMRDGRIVAERHFQRPLDQDLPSIPLPMQNLKIDSPQAFGIAEQTSRRAGLGFDTIHYQLRCRDLRNEPIWVLNLNDQKKTPVGVLYVSAVSGEVLRAIWNRPGTEQYTQVEDKPGFFGKVKNGVSSFGNRIFKGKGKNQVAQPAPMTAAPPAQPMPAPVPRR